MGGIQAILGASSPPAPSHHYILITWKRRNLPQDHGVTGVFLGGVIPGMDVLPVALGTTKMSLLGLVGKAEVV